MNQTQQIILTFIDELPVKWRMMAAQLKTESVIDAVQELDSRIEQLVRLRGYLDTMSNGGVSFGDAYSAAKRELIHNRAVKNSNRLVMAVRKLFGYIYKSEVSF